MVLPTFTGTTTAQEVANALKDNISGKNVVITGTSVRGIGYEIARALAPYAGLVVIAGHDTERMSISEAALKQEFPSANIQSLKVDLSSLAAVRKAAAEVTEPIHVLINNAATTGVYYLTEDDIEVQMATSQFGAFLFTKLLAPKLLAAKTATYVPRVVFLGSVAHHQAQLDFSALRKGDAPAVASTPAGMIKRYAETKVTNVLMARELAKRAKGQLRAFSVHPGLTPTTGFEKEALVPLLKASGVIGSDGKPQGNAFGKWKTLEQGAATPVAAAFDPRLDSHSGSYIVDSVVADEQMSSFARDPANAEKLWNLTEEILGEKFVLC